MSSTGEGEVALQGTGENYIMIFADLKLRAFLLQLSCPVLMNAIMQGASKAGVQSEGSEILLKPARSYVPEVVGSAGGCS